MATQKFPAPGVIADAVAAYVFQDGEPAIGIGLPQAAASPITTTESAMPICWRMRRQRDTAEAEEGSDGQSPAG